MLATVRFKVFSFPDRYFNKNIKFKEADPGGRAVSAAA
jgi:hypothetical protein